MTENAISTDDESDTSLTRRQSGHTSIMPGDHTIAARRDSRIFAVDAARHGMLQLKLGRLAQEKASQQEVRKFASRVVKDYFRAHHELAHMLQRKSIAQPTRLDAEQQDMVKRLERLSGAGFDRAYSQAMRDDLVKAIAHFVVQTENGTDPDIRAFARRRLPILQDHHDLAERLP